MGLQPTVRESEGTVEVCAEIENAELERDVVATIETIPGTATGRQLFVTVNYNTYYYFLSRRS